MMRRRSFLGTLAATAAALLDPEMLLWTPGKKKVILPARYTMLRIGEPSLHQHHNWLRLDPEDREKWVRLKIEGIPNTYGGYICHDKDLNTALGRPGLVPRREWTKLSAMAYDDKTQPREWCIMAAARDAGANVYWTEQPPWKVGLIPKPEGVA